jgi:hypothetical protein
MMTSPPDSISTLVDDALACLLQECPDAYRAMAKALGPRRVDLVVRDEALELSFIPKASDLVIHQELAELGDAPSINPAAVLIETSATTLHNIVTGTREAIDAIIADDLKVIASPEDLIHASEAGLFFIKGAVRCTSITPMLSRLERLAMNEREGTHDHG